MGHDHWYELIKVPQPAVGVAAKRKIPGETFERVVAIRFVLTTSAVVLNRFPGVSFLDGDGGTILRVESNVAVTASRTADVNLFTTCGGSAFSVSGEQFGPLPDLTLPPAYAVQVSSTGLDAGDQFSGINMYVCRYPSSAWTPSYGVMPYQAQESATTS